MIINGNEGNDSLSGERARPDTLIGGSGNDALTGGAGLDLLDGDGNDALNVRDGSFDLARGGAGTDSAKTDKIGVTRSTASRTWTPFRGIPPAGR